MLTFVTTTTINEGMASAYEALLLDVAAKSEAEEGCLGYQVLRIHGEQNRYLVIEQYRDKGALMVHRETDHFREAVARVGDFMAEPPQILQGEAFS